VQPQISVSSTSKTPCFFFNQTLGSVIAGEPHPQPHYQTATKLGHASSQGLETTATLTSCK